MRRWSYAASQRVAPILGQSHCAFATPSVAATHLPSYSHGTSDKPLMATPIGDALRSTAQVFSDNDALVCPDRHVRWSYAELDRRVDALASGLLSLGLKRGDRLGMWGPNCPEWTLTQFATARLGIILVTINPAYRPNELKYALNQVGCKALVMAPSVKTSDFRAILGEVAPEIATCQPGALSSPALPHLQHVMFLDQGWGDHGRRPAACHAFSHIAEGGPSKAVERYRVQEASTHVHFDDPVNIQFTSGTTGSPKGATLTHHNILNNGYFVGEALKITDKDRLCIPVPLYHCFGMVMGNLACLTHGAAMVYPSRSFDPLQVLTVVQEERCSVMYGVPSMYIAELAHPKFDSFDLTSLRTGIMSGSPCPMEIMVQVTNKMHLKDLTIAYGMTETSPVSTQSSITDSLERRVSTVGRVHPHIEIMIRGPDGLAVPRGQSGELCTRGYSVMQGYWGDADKTSQVIDKARWMQTGDLGTMDDEGYIRIVGRLKDMIIRGGENIYPRELEEVLHTHCAIDEAHVFGIPHETMGEAVCVWIRMKHGHKPITHNELKEFCKPLMAHYKIPAHLRVVDTFPMTVSGKIQKYVMRDEMQRIVTNSTH
jgi:fatty-acyl-CoA synthase